MADGRLLIISPVRNEAKHLERVIRGMTAQTRPPDVWLVVDDGSSDGTLDLLGRAVTDVPFLRVASAPQAPLPSGADRLLHAAEARAFNHGLSLESDFTHIGKLDGDIELPPDYFERLLGKLTEDPELGIAGGVLVEPARQRLEGARRLAPRARSRRTQALHQKLL